VLEIPAARSSVEPIEPRSGRKGSEAVVETVTEGCPPDSRTVWETQENGQRVTDSCHTCHLDIELRYSVTGPKSTSQGYWSHLNTAEGIAADKDHGALRNGA
jgi:hypothetical protein